MWPVSRFAKFYGFFLMLAGIVYAAISLTTLILGRSCKTQTCQVLHLLHVFLSLLTVCYGRNVYGNSPWPLPKTEDLVSQQGRYVWIITGLSSIYGIISGCCPLCWKVCASFDPDIPESIRSCSPESVAGLFFYLNLSFAMFNLNTLLFGLVLVLVLEQKDGRVPDVYLMLANVLEGIYALIWICLHKNMILLLLLQIRFIWVAFQVKIALAKRRWIPVRQVSSSFLQ